VLAFGQPVPDNTRDLFAKQFVPEWVITRVKEYQEIEMLPATGKILRESCIIQYLI